MLTVCEGLTVEALRIRYKETVATVKKRAVGFAQKRGGRYLPHWEGKADRLSDSFFAKVSRIFPTLLLPCSRWNVRDTPHRIVEEERKWATGGATE